LVARVRAVEQRVEDLATTTTRTGGGEEDE